MHLGVNIEEAQSGLRQPLNIVRGVPLERLKELGVAHGTARTDFVNLIKISICSLESALTIWFHAVCPASSLPCRWVTILNINTMFLHGFVFLLTKINQWLVKKSHSFFIKIKQMLYEWVDLYYNIEQKCEFCEWASIILPTWYLWIQ